MGSLFIMKKLDKKSQSQNIIEQQQQEDRQITIVKAVFKSDFDFQLVNQKQINDVLHREYCEIVQYKQQNWKEIFQGMVQSYNKQLNLSNNHNPRIIKQIQHVQFCLLTSILLSSNNIDNIECLLNIKLNSLQWLDLSYNHISRIVNLKKLSNSSLKTIWLRGNPLTEICSLSKSKMNFNNIDAIKNLCLDLDIDLSLIFKLNAKATDKVYQRSKQRVGQSRIENKLGLRFYYDDDF